MHFWQNFWSLFVRTTLSLVNSRDILMAVFWETFPNRYLGFKKNANNQCNYKKLYGTFSYYLRKKYQHEKVPIRYFFLRKNNHTPLGTFSQWYFLFLYTVSSVLCSGSRLMDINLNSYSSIQLASRLKLLEYS